MKNEWNMSEEDCAKYAKDCDELRKNLEKQKSLDDVTPEEYEEEQW